MSAASQSTVKPLYMTDASLLSHTALVTKLAQSEIKGKKVHIVYLNETIFHPQGGGQPSDQGTIDNYKVVSVVKERFGGSVTEFEIQHCFNEPVPFKVGQAVQLVVNAEPRQLHSRLHSAGHAIAAFVEESFPKVKAVEGHHLPGEARVRFEGQLPAVKEVEEKLKKSLSDGIKNNMQSKIVFTEKGGREHVIGNFKGMPCGGTHVNNLAELGEVNIRGVKIEKQKLTVKYDVSKIEADKKQAKEESSEKIKKESVDKKVDIKVEKAVEKENVDQKIDKQANTAQDVKSDN